MKIANAFFLTSCLFFSTQLISQNVMQTDLSSHPTLNKEWLQTDYWLQTFRTTFGKDATTNWMSELAMEGEFYLNKEHGGFIVLLPKYMHSHAKLQAKFQYGIFENKNTKLLPLVGEVVQTDNLNTTRFLGFLGGVPASLNMAVIKQGGKYLTVMGFSPGHELETTFTKNYEQLIERVFTEPVFALR